MKLGVDIGTRGVGTKVEHRSCGSTVDFGYKSQGLEHSFVRPFIPGHKSRTNSQVSVWHCLE